MLARKITRTVCQADSTSARCTYRPIQRRLRDMQPLGSLHQASGFRHRDDLTEIFANQSQNTTPGRSSIGSSTAHSRAVSSTRWCRWSSRGFRPSTLTMWSGR